MMKEFHSRENCWASGMDFPIAPSDTLQRLSTEWSMGFCADQGQLGLHLVCVGKDFESTRHVWKFQSLENQSNICYYSYWLNRISNFRLILNLVHVPLDRLVSGWSSAPGAGQDSKRIKISKSEDLPQVWFLIMTVTMMMMMMTHLLCLLDIIMNQLYQ